MPVPNNITDLSTTPAANSPAGSESPQLIDDYLRTQGAFIAQLRDEAKSRSFAVAAAGGTADAITATYSPAVTSLTNGMTLYVRAALANTTSTPTFSPNGLAATTIVRANNQPLTAGDIAGAGHWLELQYDTTLTKWVLQNPTRADLTMTALQAHGHCRLAKSGGDLLLSRYNGKSITINGALEVIPSAGVTLAATGLTPSTLYYIYAYMNAGTMTLEASTTGHSTDSVTGIEIKTGDATRTLVGMALPITGPAWQDTTKQRFVRSWFNDQGIAGMSVFTASRATTSTSYVELNTEIRNEFLIWDGEIALICGSGSSTQTTGNQNHTAAAFDGTTPEPGTYSAWYVGAGTNQGSAYSINYPKPGLSEGYHYATLIGKVGGGTGTWAGPSATDTSSLSTYIKR